MTSNRKKLEQKREKLSNIKTDLSNLEGQRADMVKEIDEKIQSMKSACKEAREDIERARFHALKRIAPGMLDYLGDDYCGDQGHRHDSSECLHCCLSDLVEEDPDNLIDMDCAFKVDLRLIDY